MTSVCLPSLSMGACCMPASPLYSNHAEQVHLNLQAAAIPIMLFGTINGVIGLVASLPKAQFDFLNRLQVLLLSYYLGGSCPKSQPEVQASRHGHMSTAFVTHVEIITIGIAVGVHARVNGARWTMLTCTDGAAGGDQRRWRLRPCGVARLPLGAHHGRRKGLHRRRPHRAGMDSCLLGHVKTSCCHVRLSPSA